MAFTEQCSRQRDHYLVANELLRMDVLYGRCGYGAAAYDFQNSWKPPKLTRQYLEEHRDQRMSTRLERRRKAIQERRIAEWKTVLAILAGFPIVMIGLGYLYRWMLMVLLG